MTLLTRDQLIAPHAAPFKDLEVKALGGTVRVQGLTLAQRDEFEKSVIISNGESVTLNRENYRAKLIVRCLVGEDGKRLLDDEHASFIGSWPAKETEVVFAQCQLMSGATKEDEKALVKNS